jgi:hypothetical protein
MPLGNTSESSSPEHQRWPPLGLRPPMRWGISIGRLGNTRFYLSPAVPLAAALLIVLIAYFAGQPGNNADLPMVAAVGTAIWIAGWLVQLAVQWLVCGGLGPGNGEVVLSLMGVQSAPRRWPAKTALWIAAISLGTLCTCGVFFWWADGGFQKPVLAPEKPAFWSPPNIGRSLSDSTWRIAAWLFWAQAICQMFPLPRTTGREMLGALTRLCSKRLDIMHQVVNFRRSLMSIAFLTMVFAIVMTALDSDAVIPRWPVVLLLAVMLWVSAHGRDVAEIIVGFQAAEELEQPEDDAEHQDRLASVMADRGRPGILARTAQAIRARRGRRRIAEAMANERREAMDVDRLDEILHQLHEQGMDSLSSEERAILRRVSDSLRKNRQQQAGED